MSLVDKIRTLGISAEYKRISSEIDKLEAELLSLQELCTHPNASKINKGSTGNWDRDDRYWKECSCPDCGKVWTEEQ